MLTQIEKINQNQLKSHLQSNKIDISNLNIITENNKFFLVDTKKNEKLIEIENNSNQNLELLQQELHEIIKSDVLQLSTNVESLASQELSKLEIKDGLQDLQRDLTENQGKEEIQEDLGQLGETVNIKTNVQTEAFKILDKSDKPLKLQDNVELESFNIYVGWNLIGSLMKKLLQQNFQEGNTINKTNFLKLLNNNKFENINELNKSLKDNNADILPAEQQILNLLLGNSLFAQEYNKQIFPEIAKTMNESMPHFIDDYNASQSNMEYIKQIPDKIANAISQGVDTLKENPDITKKTLIGAGAIGGVAAIGYKVLKWLFSDDKDTAATAAAKVAEKGGFFKKLFGFMKRPAAIGVGYYLLKNLFSTNSSKETENAYKPGPEGIESHITDYDTLPEAERNTYINFANSIDNFYTILYGKTPPDGISDQQDMLNEYKYEKANKNINYNGLVPYVLDKRYANVGEILQEKGIIIDMINVDKTTLVIKFKNRISTMGIDGLKAVSQFTGKILPEFLNNQINAGIQKLSEMILTDPNFEMKIRELFRKNIKVMSYLEIKKDDLMYKLTEKQLSQENNNFKAYSKEKQKEIIEDKIKDQDFYNKYLKNAVEKFKQSNILGVAKILNENDISNNGYIQKELKEKIDEIDTWYDEVMGKKDGKYPIDGVISTLEAKQPCTADQNEYLQNVCTGLEDKINHFGERGWITFILGPLAPYLNTEKINIEQLLESFGYKELSKDWLDHIKSCQEKLKNGTITVEDVKNLQEVAKDFSYFQKEVMTGAINLQEVKKDDGTTEYLLNGNLALRKFGKKISLTFKALFTGHFDQFGKELQSLSLVEGIGIRGLLRMTPGVGTYAIKPTTKLATYPLKIALYPIEYPITSLLKKTSYVGRFLYRGDDGIKLLRYDFLTGRINEKEAVAVAKKLYAKDSLKVIDSGADILDEIFDNKLKTVKTDIIMKYRKNKQIREQLFEDKSLIKSIYDFCRNKNPKLNLENIRLLETIDDIITKADPNKKVILQNFLEKSSLDLNKLYQLSDTFNKSVNLDKIFTISKIDPIKFSKYILKYGDKIDDIESLFKFYGEGLESLKTAGKTINEVKFLENTFKNRSAIQSEIKGSKTAAQIIESMEVLEGGKINFVRKNLTNLSVHLRNLLKSGKVSPSIKTTIEKTADIADDIIKGPDTALAGATSHKLGKFGKCGLIIGSIIERGMMFYDLKTGIQEANEISKDNSERGQTRLDQTYINTGLRTTSASFLTYNAFVEVFSGLGRRNPGGWAALGVMGGVELAKHGVDKYYEVIDFYQHNIEDFKKLPIQEVKLDIISALSRNYDINTSFQEKRQEGWALVTKNLSADMKNDYAKINTIPAAINGIIYMEEIKNYPNSLINMNIIPEDKLTQIKQNKEKDENGLRKVMNFRSEFITNHLTNLTPAQKNEFEAKPLDYLNNLIILSSQAFIVSNDTEYTGNKNISNYQNYLKDKLIKDNNEGFNKLEKLYTTNKVEFIRQISMVKYYNQLQIRLNGDISPDQKTKIEFIEKYFNYKTFGTPENQLDLGHYSLFDTDFNAIENFINEFKISSSGIEDNKINEHFKNGHINIYDKSRIENELKVSSSIGQNILYRIASEIGGYSGPNNISDLKLFFVESKKDTYGIYYCGDGFAGRNVNSWYVNNIGKWMQIGINPVYNAVDPSIAGDDKLNNLKVIENFKQNIINLPIIDTQIGTGIQGINKNIKDKILAIIDNEIQIRNEAEADIKKYIQDNSKGKYIELSPDLISKGIKTGFENVGSYIYKLEGKKIIGKGIDINNNGTKITGIEYINVSNEINTSEYNAETNKCIEKVDSAYQKIIKLSVANDNDLDLNDNIKFLLSDKYQTRKSLQNKAYTLEKTKGEDLLQSKSQEYIEYFENAYIILLSLSARSGLITSNDVDKYDDFRLLSTILNNHVNIINIPKDGPIQTVPEIKNNNIKYKFTLLLNDKNIISENGKSITDLCKSDNSVDQEKGNKYAKILLKSLLESCMLKYDNSGNILEIKGFGGDINDNDFKKRLEFNLSNK